MHALSELPRNRQKPNPAPKHIRLSRAFPSYPEIARNLEKIGEDIDTLMHRLRNEYCNLGILEYPYPAFDAVLNDLAVKPDEGIRHGRYTGPSFVKPKAFSELMGPKRLALFISQFEFLAEVLKHARELEPPPLAASALKKKNARHSANHHIRELMRHCSSTGFRFPTSTKRTGFYTALAEITNFALGLYWLDEKALLTGDNVRKLRSDPENSRNETA